MPCPEPEIRPLLLYQRYQYIAHRERKVADFARNTPYKQYIFGAWNRIITYYLRNREYDSAIQELKNIRKKPFVWTILTA